MKDSKATFPTSLARLFNEGVMGLLALVALATALGPMVFEVGPDVERTLTVVEWVLVGAFAAEFLIHGAVAQNFRAWIRSPWRIVGLGVKERGEGERQRRDCPLTPSHPVPLLDGRGRQLHWMLHLVVSPRHTDRIA